MQQAENQKNENFILVYSNDWHNGVLGIVASKIINKFNKPTIVISFTNSLGVGSARSIKSIDLGNIILNAKKNDLLISGGGHKMAAGLKLKLNNIFKFKSFVKNSLDNLPEILFQKFELFDSILSCNEINNDLLDTLERMEPFGSGNTEPQFILNDISILSVKVLKNKHLLILFQNDFSLSLKAICFNCLDTSLGDYLINHKKFKLAICCNIRRDNFKDISTPQIIIKDAMIIN